VSKHVLVIGGTGHVGGQVVDQLLNDGARVRVLARTPENVKLSPEVEVVSGDLTRPETLDACLQKTDTVFLVWVAPPASVPAAIERIARHTQRIVFLSSPFRHPHPFFQAAQPNPISALHAAIEEAIKASGLAWTFIRPGMFAAMTPHWWGPQLRVGDAVRWPYALAPTSPIHEGDIAAVAVHGLCGDYSGAEYVVTGPESLTHRDMVATVGEVLGRPLRLEEITPDQWLAELPDGMPPAIAKMLMLAWKGGMGQPALVTSTVADVTGKPARTFREWTEEHSTLFGSDAWPSSPRFCVRNPQAQR
jgi:uncharacterized protein YbjT (DUF2867 family)